MHRLKKGATIWCPFDTEDSQFVRVLSDNGFNVVFGHIDSGQDFFEYEPDNYNYIISNPPFSIKTQVMKRLVELNKPFAMLLNLTGIFDSKDRFELFKTNKVEMLWLSPRVEYGRKEEKLNSVPYQSGYLCRGICKNQLEFEYIDKSIENL